MQHQKILLAAAAMVMMTGCEGQPSDNGSSAAPNSAADASTEVSLTRLDCGKIRIKEFDSFFSDRAGLYAKGPRDVTDSCYLIQHGDQQMLWDTGVTAKLKGGSFDAGSMVMSLDRTIADQLAELNLTPADIDVVGISHGHGDHIGQAGLFPQARLIIGEGDVEIANEPPPDGGASPIAPWLKQGANVTRATADVDVFGDGSVVALHLPGHTPDHLALLVKLKSGPVLLSGDLYHSAEAREKRGVPPFNTSREQTVSSMDKFDALAKQLGAKVVIQHEPADIAKLPSFPEAAK